jgi:hypothetical protein
LEKPGKTGKTWKNQEGDLNATQKILRNLQAVHDVDQLLAKKKVPCASLGGTLVVAMA